jgi:hypothetical protein
VGLGSVLGPFYDKPVFLPRTHPIFSTVSSA